MKKITHFFLICSGSNLDILNKCPTEKSKYVGIGAAIFFTGIFAFMAAAYAIHTVFEISFISAALGLIWGFMIFNLDRYVVCSMRKEGKYFRELFTALPRLLLAIMISMVIVKPLELKIFEKEIEAEVAVMEQQAYARLETAVKTRFSSEIDKTTNQIAGLKQEIHEMATKRNELVRLAREEADGTGGSRIKNLGPIYKIKKADADHAEDELLRITRKNEAQITDLESQLRNFTTQQNKEITNLQHSQLSGLAARLEALNRISISSSTIWGANIFLIFLFITVETAPILVKLISSKGPYDNLLRIEEHRVACLETEKMAINSAKTKGRTKGLPEVEKNYIAAQLDSGLT